MSYSYLFKFIIIGDPGVGKSCLLTQFIEKKFNTKYAMTVGVEFISRIILINEAIIKLQIWDTSGQENFMSVTRSYYRSIAGVILVYDITNRDWKSRESFQNILRWYEDAKMDGNPEITYIMIGNKNDLTLERTVYFDEGKEIADQNDFLFLETSAKTGDNVEEVFLRTSFRIYKKVSDFSKEIPGVKMGDQNKDFTKTKESLSLNERKCSQKKTAENSCCD